MSGRDKVVDSVLGRVQALLTLTTEGDEHAFLLDIDSILGSLAQKGQEPEETVGECWCELTPTRRLYTFRTDDEGTLSIEEYETTGPEMERGTPIRLRRILWHWPPDQPPVLERVGLATRGRYEEDFGECFVRAFRYLNASPYRLGGTGAGAYARLQETLDALNAERNGGTGGGALLTTDWEDLAHDAPEETMPRIDPDLLSSWNAARGKPDEVCIIYTKNHAGYAILRARVIPPGGRYPLGACEPLGVLWQQVPGPVTFIVGPVAADDTFLTFQEACVEMKDRLHITAGFLRLDMMELERRRQETEEALVRGREAEERLAGTLTQLDQIVRGLPSPEVEDARQAGAPVAAPPGADDEVRGALEDAGGVGVTTEDLELDAEAHFFR